MAECVRQRLAQRLRRVKRIIHSLKKGWHNTRPATGKFSRRKRSALRRSPNALSRNCRLSRNSVRSMPRKRAIRSRHCGISTSTRSVFPNKTTAARNSTSPLTSPRPRSSSTGSRVPGSLTRFRRIDSSTVSRISDISRSSTDHPVAGWFSHCARFLNHHLYATDASGGGLVFFERSNNT